MLMMHEAIDASWRLTTTLSCRNRSANDDATASSRAATGLSVTFSERDRTAAQIKEWQFDILADKSRIGGDVSTTNTQ